MRGRSLLDWTLWARPPLYRGWQAPARMLGYHWLRIELMTGLDWTKDTELQSARKVGTIGPPPTHLSYNLHQKKGIPPPAHMFFDQSTLYSTL